MILPILVSVITDSTLEVLTPPTATLVSSSIAEVSKGYREGLAGNLYILEVPKGTIDLPITVTQGANSHDYTFRI